MEFISLLKDFMLNIICDKNFLIVLETDPAPIEYELEYLGEQMVNTEGMFATIATVTNFMVQFLDNQEVLGFTIIIFRRLFNFFPHYRPHLEEPIIMIMLKVLRVFS